MTFNDLDLHTVAGRDTLRLRVQAATRNVCGPAEGVGSTGFASYDACLTNAQANATHRVDALIASATTAERVASN